MIIKIYLVGIVICLSGLCVSCRPESPARLQGMSLSPSQVVRKFIELTQREDAVDEQKKLFSRKLLSDLRISEARRDYSGAVIYAFPLTVSQFGGVRSVVIQRENIAGDTADILVKVILNWDAEADLAFKLIKQDGEWKIDGVDFTGGAGWPSPQHNNSLNRSANSAAFIRKTRMLVSLNARPVNSGVMLLRGS